MAILWTWVWEPLLFVTIGNSIDFATLNAGIVPKSLIIICTGVCRPCLAQCAWRCWGRRGAASRGCTALEARRAAQAPAAAPLLQAWCCAC